MLAANLCARRLARTSLRNSRRTYCSSEPRVLVVCEHTDGAITAGTLSTITAANKLGKTDALVMGGADSSSAASACASVKGVNKVLHCVEEQLKVPMAESIAPVVREAVESGKYSHVLTPSSTFGKNFLPRVAATAGVGVVSDILSVESASVFKRPIYAGNAIATVESNDPIKAITVRTTAFPKAETGDQKAQVEKMDCPPAATSSGKSKYVSSESAKSERPELTAADRVVSGGRALKSSENFNEYIVSLADTLKAAVGASRAAVDDGYAPNEWQVGQTGKVVAPQLYLAVGISGAIQHLAGMKDSKVIVAINKDAEAPIFQVADYGLVADLYKAVPELTDKLKGTQ